MSYQGKVIHKETPRVKLVSAMLGKEFDDIAGMKPAYLSASFGNERIIDAKGLGHNGTIKPFDLQVHKGEVVGLTGLLGSGRSELVRAIYGADRTTSGELYAKDKKVDIREPIDAMHHGMGYLPDDRKGEGIIGDLSVRENIILAMQSKRGIFKLLPRNQQEEIADRYIKLLQIKTASRETPIKQLSGGNQQKVILARWLATDPDFLILDEPTRGIDIGIKAEIQKLVLQLAREGKSVIFISSEIEEMLRTCTRLAVLRDGEKVGELNGELSQECVIKRTREVRPTGKLKNLTSRRLFLPVFCMFQVMAVNVFHNIAQGNAFYNFFTISIRNDVLYGRLIDILNRGSEIAILAVGMTLVVSSSAGADISVGSVMSLAASFCCMLLAGFGVSSASEFAVPIWVGIFGGLAIACLCGVFNGSLVAYLGIQPMVATLILYSAARRLGCCCATMSSSMSAYHLTASLAAILARFQHQSSSPRSVC